MENTLKDLGQKVEGVENKIPTKNYFSKDYNINLELPVSMSSIDRKVKYYDINQAMSDEDRANWFGKIIPLDEQDRILKNYKPSPKEESGVKTFFSEGGKSFWNTTQDILTYPYQWGIQKSAGLGVNVAEKVAEIKDFPVNENDKEKSVLEVEKELNPNYEDTKFNLKEAEMWSPAWWGQGSGNVTASLVLPIFTGKVPYTALSFGMMTDTDVTRARLEQGDSLLEANAKGSSSGAAISALELLHIDTLTKRVILPRVQRYLARFVTGATVETAQQGVEDVAMGDADTRTPEQKRGAYISSIVFGGMGDVVGHIARDTATRKTQKEVKNKALKEGYSETLATELAQTSMVDENPDYEKVSQELKKEVNQRQDVRRGEVYEEFIKQGDSPEIASKKANELVPSVEEVESEILDDLKNGKLVKEEDIENLKQAYTEATSVANEDADKYILMKDEIKSLIEKAGKDEQEADETARMMTSIAINSYQIAKEQGVDVDFDKIKNEVFKLNNIINYAQNEPISEAEQDDIWREVERERVAELQEGIDKYMEESQGGVLYSQTLTTREDGYKIADDNETVDVVRISENAVPDFKSKKELVKFIKNILGNERNITIDSTGDVVLVSNGAINRVAIKARDTEYNEAFSAVRGIIKNAKYSGFEVTDEEHPNVRGQDVYHSALIVGNKPYSVRFKVDIPLENGTHNYAGHKVTDIKIASPNSSAEGFNSPMTNEDAISKVTLAVLRGKVNPARKENGKLYSQTEGGGKVDINTPEFKAWSKNSEVVEFDKVDDYSFTGKPITIEMEHGTNRGGFTEFDEGMIGTNSMASSGFFFGSRNISRTYSKNRAEIRKEDIDWWKSNHSEDENRELSGVYRVYVHFDNPAVYDFKGASWNGVAYGQYAIYNENDYGYETDEFGDYLLFDSYAKAENYLESKNIYDYKDGRSISDRSRETKYSILSDPEIFLSTNELAEEAKQNGFDGVIFENIDDSGSYNQAFAYNGTVAVAFNPNQIKSVYNQGTFSPETNDIFNSQTEGDILGSYDIAKREVELFKGHNPSTLTHELGHHFIISHLNFMESIGANDKNKPVFEFLSGLANREINSVRDMEIADHENLVEAFIDYMNIGQAPNIVTGNIFQRAKNWLINEYNIHKTTASKEIREYFDTLISREGAIPDVSKIQDRIGEFKEILRQAQKGEQVSFNGMGIKEVKDLKKAINTKIRRKGLSLRDELIKAGGIKEGTELAKSLGFDVLKKDKMFTTKEHAIEKEDELIEWLAEKGYITPVQEGESYSDTEARWSEVENLIYDAERVYRPEEQRLNEEREASLVNQAKAQEIVDDILKDNKLGLKGVNDLYDLLQKISSRKDDVDIIKINKGAIKYLETRLNDLQRDYNDIIKQKDIEARKIGKELIKANEDIRNLKEEKAVSKIEKNVAQEQYLDFVRNQHLSGDNKVKFLSKVNEINSFNDLVRVVRRLTPQIQRVIEMEMKHIQKRNIDIVLKRSKPKKRTQQISTYTYNKFFEELRAINKMTKDEAKVGISNLMKEMEKRDENMEGFAFEWKDIIKNKFLHYKSLGMEASLDLMTSLHNDLIELYGEAVQKGIDTKIEKSDKRLAEINKVNDYVENNQVARNFISNLFNPNGKSDDVYIKNTNFYGISNALFGKKWADEHEMVTVLNQVQNDVYKRHDQMIKKAKEIYKVGKRNKLQDVMAEKNSKDFILTANDGLSYELSIMDIMDLYLGLKNEKTKRQLLKNYEEFDEEGEQITSQIDDLIGNLSVEDKEFADWLQKDLEKNYDELNKLYIKMYGIDMKQEENYFPRKSERRDVILDLENINSYSPIQAISGMMKDRASFVKPLAVNVLQKYEENIAEYYYMIDAFEKFKDIYDVVTSKDIRASVNKKYSKDTYTALTNSLKSMSLRGMQVHTSDIDGTLNKIVSNVIGSKIAVNVDVFLKQLISFTNYSEKMPVKEFTHNFIEAITHPKETIEFMNNFDKEFFEARKNMGLQSEAVSRMKRELENMKHNNFFEEKFNVKGLKISAGFRYQWSQAMGFMVKYGDIGAIYFGGYARAKNLLDSGMSVEEARKQFRLETLQSQQDSSPANLAQYQFSKNGFARLFSAFLNAPAQYMRKMYDADIQYRRKEITAEQFRKTIINYGVIQPALFVLVGNMLRDLWDGDDESSWFDGMASQILTSPLQGIPFLGNMVTQVASYVEKEIVSDKGNTYNLVSVLLADDLNRAFNKIGKEDKGALDWIDILTPLFETVAVTPVAMAKKVVKAVETRID